MCVNKLVLLRHGESTWNKENRFTGWCDIDLSKKGLDDAKKAGILFKKHGFIFDVAYTSFLKRAIHTLNIILDEIDQAWIPVKKSWRLNERHYGALQGLNKDQVSEQYSSEQVKLWRRSFNVIPPLQLDRQNKYFIGYDIKYHNLSDNIPVGESLKMTSQRVIFYWNKNILPKIKNNKKVIIVAHGNSLRALIKHIDQISEQEIVNTEIPTGKPLIYEFDKNITPIQHYYL